jgi:uracil-DNA glycosylase family 4
MTAQEPQNDSLEAVATEVRGCVRCPLSQTRTKAVPGEGPADAEVLFIGEGPGLNEDRTGRPFVGAAGQFLDELLAQANLKRSDCFITNVVKCRPPENRDPEPGEIAACAGYLDRQIALLKPKLIVTLGRFSMAKYFPGESISRIHGKLRNVGGQLVLPMFHPAAGLRRPETRTALMQDFKQIPLALEAARKNQAPPPEKKPEDEPPPQQMTLF